VETEEEEEEGGEAEEDTVQLSLLSNCSVSVPHVKIVHLLDVHQLLMLFAEMLTYLEPETFT
jgi:hypothetical protein